MRVVAACIALVLLAGCGKDAATDRVLQTKAPGHVTAGGLTSGDVMAKTAQRGPLEPGPAGTPGIPQGAGGTTSGAAMGGTTPAAPPGTSAAANAAATAGASAASAPAAANAPAVPAMSDAERQARSLAASMDAVAARWRARAGSQGWPVNAATPVDPLAGFQASANQASPSGQPQGTLSPAAAQMPVRSEKLGTAPPSPDIKTGAKPPTDPVLDPKSPEAAGR
jgi:hypothetical protein